MNGLPRIVRVLITAVLAAFPGLDAAAASPEDEQIEAARKQAELFDRLSQEISKLSTAEEEQKALLRELAETDDELARERAEKAELRRELERLTGEPAGRTSPEAPRAVGAPAQVMPRRTMKIPARQVNALGIVDSREVAVAQAPEGATNLRLVPLAGVLPQGVVVREGDRGLVIEQESEVEGGAATRIAEVRLGEGDLRWSWRLPAPAPLEGTLAALDRVLAMAVVEARGDGRVLAEYQQEPAVVRAAVRKRDIEVPLPQLVLMPLAVKAEDATKAWVWSEKGDGTLEAASLAQAVAVGWKRDEGVVAIRVGPGVIAAQAQTSREMAAWEGDLVKLNAASPRDADEIGRVEAEVDRLKRRRDDLQQAREGIVSDAGPLTVLLVAPNGVVCGRITLTFE